MGGTARMSTEPVKSRVALFIDFWNFTLNMKKLDESFLIDWFKIPSAFIQYLQDGWTACPMRWNMPVVRSSAPTPLMKSLCGTGPGRRFKRSTD